LDAEETAGYVQHRLHTAGGNGAAIFTPEALSGVYRYTQGVPRLINGLCDGALLSGYVHEAKVIGSDIIEEVAGELPSLVETPSVTATAHAARGAGS
jgi:type II secretory pathway predicted ATPase ExeA